MTVPRVLGLFVLAALAEIGGAGLIWQGVREHRGAAFIGAGILANLLNTHVLVLGLALTPGVLAGAWTGQKITDRVSETAFVALVEVGLLVAGVLFLLDP